MKKELCTMPCVARWWSVLLYRQTYVSRFV